MLRSLVILLAVPLGAAMSLGELRAQSAFPSVDELPRIDTLPDPFQFFASDRRVESMKDWNTRRAEMLRMIKHYVSGPAFPQTHNAKLQNRQTRIVYPSIA